MRATRRRMSHPVLCLALFALAAHGFAQEPRRPPRFEGKALPEPPRQREPWQPPASALPKFLARAATILFEQGLADPRGCEYRAIEIGVGSVWSSEGGVVRTHGWVLPAARNEEHRFAVAWNGLVYPTVSIGEPADLAADVKGIAEHARAARVRDPGGMMGHSAFNGFGTNDESSAVSGTSLHAIKLCLLLRLGRAELAQSVWTAATGQPPEAGKPASKATIDLNGYGVSYVSLANDLAWYLFDRAVCAHMRGDDALALVDARKLAVLQKAVETQAEALGFDRPRDHLVQGARPGPYIPFLEQLPELLGDQERRAREPKRLPLMPGADKKARIADLIAGLDQVAVRQFGQPGGVSLGESPVVKALVEAGDEAVEPLLVDLEQDVRLTRSVHFHRDFFRSRTIMGAHEAAYTALSGILKTSFFGPGSTGGNLTASGREGRVAVADQIRAYWMKNRNVSLVERWYRTLADDHAQPNAWLQAAGNIVQHENVRIIPGSTAFTSTVTTALRPGARPKLRGEVLRDKQNPSVAELMALRVKAIDPGGPLDPNSGTQYRAGSANQMAGLLAEWDLPAALPVLKARVERCARAVQDAQAAGARLHGMEEGIARLTTLRNKGDDPEALPDYARWIRTVTPTHFDFAPIAMFEPLWRNPDHPAAIAAATALFEDPKSPWNPSIKPRELNTDGGHRLELLGSSLLALKSFRTLVQRALADRTQVGTVEVNAKGAITVIQGNQKTVETGESTSSEAVSSGEPAPGAGSPFKPGPSAMPLRVADQVCEQLQRLDGIPRFQKQWPLEKRDQALAACIAYLKQYGERFRENEASRALQRAEPGTPRHEFAFLAFDPLDRPATAADVAEGRAIFSLAGAGTEVRRLPLPSFPLRARWTKLEVFPNEPPIMRVYDAEGREHPATEELQTGRVWQAEEVREGTRWRRYYGFAGRHALTRVVDEEIEFRADWYEPWRWVSPDLDARITVTNQEPLATGPIPFELAFRNHRGTDANAPADLIRKNADGSFTIREGITFRLIRESDKTEAPNPFVGSQGGEAKPFPPEEIPARPVRRHRGDALPLTLTPAGTVNALQLDLRTLFAVDRPGRYRLEIRFDDWKGKDGTPGKVDAVFPVTASRSIGN